MSFDPAPKNYTIVNLRVSDKISWFLRKGYSYEKVFHSVKETKVLVERWRLEYNNHRPHSGLDYMNPAAFAGRITWIAL
ncbi:MAG: transposase [Planctomycetes bacterium]|nr:transposase [Planctomycetota bacterium]